MLSGCLLIPLMVDLSSLRCLYTQRFPENDVPFPDPVNDTLYDVLAEEPLSACQCSNFQSVEPRECRGRVVVD